jgi:hypothetical protein
MCNAAVEWFFGPVAWYFADTWSGWDAMDVFPPDHHTNLPLVSTVK